MHIDGKQINRQNNWLTIDKWRADKTRVYKVQNLQGNLQYSIRNSSCDICRIILLNVLTMAIIIKRMICLKYPFLNSFLIYCRGLLIWNVKLTWYCRKSASRILPEFFPPTYSTNNCNADYNNDHNTYSNNHSCTFKDVSS